MKTEPDDPAGIGAYTEWQQGEDGGIAIGKDSAGLTKREYLAAKALQGVYSNLAEAMNMHPKMTPSEIALDGADGLIKALNKPKPN